MGAQSVGYWQAWGLWWQGQDLKALSLYGFPMIWIGRIAKLSSFVAALTVILDIVGQDWMVRASSSVRSNIDPGFAVGIAIVFFIFSGAAVGSALVPNSHADSMRILQANGLFIGVLVTFFALCSAGLLLTWFIMGLLDSSQKQRRIRWISFLLFAWAFHLDLLTS